MDSLLHPVGPEPVAVYWTRRVVVLTVLLLLSSMIVAFGSRHKDSPAAAVPASTPSTAPAPASPAATPASPSTRPASPTAAAASVSPSRSATPTGTSAPRTTVTASPPSRPSAKPAGPVACKAADVAVAVDAARTMRAGDTARLRVRLTNEGPTTCLLAMSADNVAVTIKSGTDRIWTTGHCAAWLPGIPQQELDARKHVDMHLTWQGKRSKAGCTLRKDAAVRPGTYVVEAVFAQTARGRAVVLLR